jgi:hypothetical protein
MDEPAVLDPDAHLRIPGAREQRGELGKALVAVGEDLEDVLVGTRHDIEDLRDVVVGEALMEEITYRI